MNKKQERTQARKALFSLTSYLRNKAGRRAALLVHRDEKRHAKQDKDHRHEHNHEHEHEHEHEEVEVANDSP